MIFHKKVEMKKDIKQGTISIADHCLKCPWGHKDGNKIFCMFPSCFLKQKVR